MTTWLKQSTATDVELGPFVDDSDFKTPETGLTISQADCQLIKNGGSAAQKNNSTSATHLAGGHYKIPLNTTDTDTPGRLRLYVNESGALPVWRDFMVVPAEVYDALVAGTDNLTADVTSASQTAITGAVWDELLEDHDSTGSFGEAVGEAGTLTVADIAEAVWDELTEDHVAAGSVGEALINASELMSVSQTPITAVPSEADGLAKLIQFIAITELNRFVGSRNDQQVYAADGTTVLATRTITNDGTTVDKTAWSAPSS